MLYRNRDPELKPCRSRKSVRKGGEEEERDRTQTEYSSWQRLLSDSKTTTRYVVLVLIQTDSKEEEKLQKVLKMMHHNVEFSLFF